MSLLNKIMNTLCVFLKYICAFLVMLIMSVTFIQVVKRYFFKSAFFWAEELVLLSMVFLVYLGSSIAVHQNDHPKIDVIFKLLNKKMGTILEIIDYLIITFFISFLGFSSIPIIKLLSTQTTIGLHISKGIMFSAILAGSFLVSLFSIHKILQNIVKLTNYNAMDNVSPFLEDVKQETVGIGKIEEAES